jgi:hypothetical protein
MSVIFHYTVVWLKLTASNFFMQFFQQITFTKRPQLLDTWMGWLKSHFSSLFWRIRTFYKKYFDFQCQTREATLFFELSRILLVEMRMFSLSQNVVSSCAFSELFYTYLHTMCMMLLLFSTKCLLSVYWSWNPLF